MKLKDIAGIAVLFMAFIFIGVLVAGCAQPSDNSGNSPIASTSTPSNSYPQNGMYHGNASYSGHGFSGFVNNETLMNSAASQLGVSEQDLKNALTPSNGQRINFTDAAAQLGVTPDQLRTALGFPAGGFHGNYGNSQITPGVTP